MNPSEQKLIRRGFDLGDANLANQNASTGSNQSWSNGEPIVLRAVAQPEIATHARDIARSAELCQHILSGESAEQVFDETDYSQRWSSQFEALGTSVNPAAQQEIETLFFDGLSPEQELIEDLWLKVSWLSFYEGDKSLRFRFSFGIDHEEDVAADPLRQRYAADLADALFPESAVISQNDRLLQQISAHLPGGEPRFVERIIYFNAPQGGAYLHHDLERGHAGVVYVQASGRTCWLALPKSELLNNISQFLQNCVTSNEWPDGFSVKQRQQLELLANDGNALMQALDSFEHNALIRLINETPSFVQNLIACGHGYVLNEGDAILLPQQTSNTLEPQNCCWHSVFCLGDMTGEGLSFAIRTD